MNKKFAVSVTLLLFAAGLTFAQSSGGEFQLIKSTVDNGGGTSTGGDFSLTGTLGQPEANRQVSSDGEFLLAGGFWATAIDAIFKNGFESD